MQIDAVLKVLNDALAANPVTLSKMMLDTNSGFDALIGHRHIVIYPRLTTNLSCMGVINGILSSLGLDSVVAIAELSGGKMVITKFVRYGSPTEAPKAKPGPNNLKINDATLNPKP